MQIQSVVSVHSPAMLHASPKPAGYVGGKACCLGSVAMSVGTTDLFLCQGTLSLSWARQLSWCSWNWPSFFSSGRAVKYEQTDHDHSKLNGSERRLPYLVSRLLQT